MVRCLEIENPTSRILVFCALESTVSVELCDIYEMS